MLSLAATWPAVVTFLPTLLLEKIGIALTLSGPLLGFLYYGLIPFSIFGGWLSKKVLNRKQLLWVPALLNVRFGMVCSVVALAGDAVSDRDRANLGGCSDVGSLAV